jgi:hypothetical protein
VEATRRIEPCLPIHRGFFFTAAIFVPHSHHGSAYIANQTGAIVYGSTSTRNVALGGGVPENRAQDFDASRYVKVGRFTITSIPNGEPAWTRRLWRSC